MQSNKENHASFWQNPVLKGSMVGAAALAAVTPGLNWTNHAMKNKPFGWRTLLSGKAFYGAGDYARSAAPSYALAFTVQSAMASQMEPSWLNQLVCAAVGGGAAGAAQTPFEGLAQTRQLSDLPAKQVRQRIVAANGWTALFRGGLSVVFRESSWAVAYLFAPKFFAAPLTQWGLEQRAAETVAGFCAGAFCGLATSPANRLRFAKQATLAEPSNNRSYWHHIKALWQQEANASTSRRLSLFFKGAPQRAVTAGTAVVLLSEGMRQYDELTLNR